ncbi:hypothetical protein V7S43_012847 [Phytophthora oleae]|uniref:Ankyrin repeat protein n=1 Tax=Phytophthora oleae TaxID=2107226 RepID=A0ABD3F5B9_9STRA
MIEWVEAHFPGCPVTCSVVEEIASRGWLWLLQLLLPGRGRTGIRASNKALDKAASNGYWDVVHWLVENASGAWTGSSNSLVAIAVTANNLEELMWLMERGSDSFPEFPECTK